MQGPWQHGAVNDAVALAQKLGMLLEGGRRVATYKLATLLALLDACAEAVPTPGPDDAVDVSILELADRVIDLYWLQVRDYGAVGVLRQSSQPRAIILAEVAALHALAAERRLRVPAALRSFEPDRYAQHRRKIARTLAREPLRALQTPSGAGDVRVPFLYEDSWLHKSVSARELEARDWRLELLPGVADGLVRLGGLLRPVIEGAWTEDVARHNRLGTEHEQLTGFLFGVERSSLLRAARELQEIEGRDCFYCGHRIAGNGQVDHFLPWARVPFNGLANLVLADARCNGSKSDHLASIEHRERWSARDRYALESAGEAVRWPAEWERAEALARGLYARLPAGTPLWRAPGVWDLTR